MRLNQQPHGGVLAIVVEDVTADDMPLMGFEDGPLAGEAGAPAGAVGTMAGWALTHRLLRRLLYELKHRLKPVAVSVAC